MAFILIILIKPPELRDFFNVLSLNNDRAGTAFLSALLKPRNTPFLGHNGIL